VTCVLSLGFETWEVVSCFPRHSRRIPDYQEDHHAPDISSAALALAAGTGNRGGVPGLLAGLADGQRTAGQHAAAVGTVESGLVMATETGQHFWDAGLYHLKGELLLATDPASSAEAEVLFCRALDIARAQEAKAFELLAATSLARLWQRQGKRAEARALLAPVYAWFTEGFDTADLVEAKALLDELT
jgi:predicted ATPase